MASHERGQACDVLIADVGAVGAQLLQDGVQVAGVAQHEGIEDQAERAELVLSELAQHSG